MTRALRENLFRFDPAEAGCEPEAYAVFEMPDARAPARIRDFDPAIDALHLQLLDGAVFGLVRGHWPEATIAYDPASDSTAIAVNGVIVAHVDGNPEIDPAEITVTALI